MIASDLPRDENFRPIAECRFDDVYSVFCSARHPLTSDGVTKLDQVLAERWVMPKPGTTPRVLLEQILRKAERSMPVISVESGSADAMIAYVARTKLLGWLPRPLLAAEHRRGTIHLLAVKELTLPRRFFVYRRRRGLLPAAIIELLKVLPLVASEDH
jgi:DNA-binding transcriptional LysR family regulator